jgi:ATP-dependent Zn protease
MKLLDDVHHLSSLNMNLENTTNMCRTMFGFGGISLDMRNPEKISNNLTVVVDRASDSEDAHIEELTRQYLKKQYDFVFNLFSLNKYLLTNIAIQLKKQRILNQKELSEIYQNHLASKTKKAA